MSFVITAIERRDPSCRFRQSYTALYIHHTTENEIMGYEVYDSEIQKNWVFVSAENLKPSVIEKLTQELEGAQQKAKDRTIDLDEPTPPAA